MLIRGTEETVVLILVVDVTLVEAIILPIVVIDTVRLDPTVVVVPMIEGTELSFVFNLLDDPVIIIVIHPTDRDLVHTRLQVVVAVVIVLTIQHRRMVALHRILPSVRILRVINRRFSFSC